jgi:prevent-host-death family protein
MYQANIHEAKTNLSALLKRVDAGEEVLIARAGVPGYRIVPAVEKKKRKKKEPFFGCMKGKIWVSPDFDKPLPEWEAWSKASLFPDEKLDKK